MQTKPEVHNTANDYVFKSVTHTLLKPAIYSFSTRGLGPISSFLLMLLLARILGAEASGAIYLSITVITLCSIIAKLGFDMTLQRFAGSAAQQGNWSRVKLIYKQAMISCIILSLIISMMLLYMSPMISSTLLQNSEYSSLLSIMSITIIPFSWFGIQAGMLKAIGKPAWGGFIEVAALPLITIFLVGLVSSYDSINTISISICYLIGAITTALIGTWIVLRHLPDSKDDCQSKNNISYSSCLSLTLVELMNYAMLWIPFLFLGAITGPSEAGSYNVAYRLSAQLGLLIVVFSSIAAPRFAAYHDTNNKAGLISLARKTTRILAMAGILPALLLLLYPDAIMVMFGAEFTTAGSVLTILVVGQLVNLATGPVGYVLAMTGNEKVLRNILGICTILTLILSVSLIPSFGATGAAWTVSISMIIQNLLCCLQIQQRLNFPFLLLLAPRVG